MFLARRLERRKSQNVEELGLVERWADTGSEFENRDGGVSKCMYMIFLSRG